MPKYPENDRRGLHVPVEDLKISPEEAKIIAQVVSKIEPGPMNWHATPAMHAAQGYLTRMDVLMLNRYLMVSPIPGAQELLDRLRTAVSKEERK